MKKAVLYARVSGDLQRKEGTIESQILALKKQVVDAGSILIKQYIDDGFSGAELDRPAMNELRKDLKTNLFETIYFLSTDRIAREVTYQTIIIGEMIKYQKQIIINGQDYVDLPENKFSLTVLGAVAELERAKIIERTTRGRHLRLAQGQLMGAGSNTFGYTYIRKELTTPPRMVVNEREAAIVRYIFTTYAQGNVGYNQITRYLEESGHLTKNGNRIWRNSIIKTILKNETYCGMRYFNKLKTVREYSDLMGTKKSTKKHLKRDRSEWVGINVPAIIPQALFDKVQERIAWNKRHYRNPRKIQLLSTLIKCGYCGLSFFAYRRYTRRYRKTIPNYIVHKMAYKCSWRARWQQHSKNVDHKKCPSREVKSEVLEERILALVRETILHPAPLRSHMDILKHKTKIAHVRLEQQLQDIEQNIQKLHDDKKRLLDVYISKDLSKEQYAEKSMDIDNEINRLKGTREDVSKQIPILHKAEVIDTSIKQYCETAKIRFEKCLDFETQRKFLLDYIERITFWNDRIEVRGSVPILSEKGDGGSKIEFCIGDGF